MKTILKLILIFIFLCISVTFCSSNDETRVDSGSYIKVYDDDIYDIAVGNNYIYISRDAINFEIIDINTCNDTNAKNTINYYISNNDIVTNLLIQGNYLFYVFHNTAVSGFQILDINSSPTNPQPIGRYETTKTSFISDICISGSNVFLLRNPSTIEFVNINNIISPSMINELTMTNDFSRFLCNTNYIYTYNYNCFTIEVSNNLSLDPIGTFFDHSSCLALEDTKIITFDSLDYSFKAFDISNPINPTLTNTSSWQQYIIEEIFFSNNLLYCIAFNKSEYYGSHLISSYYLYVIDVSNGVNIISKLLLSSGGEANNSSGSNKSKILIKNNLAYFELNHIGLILVDISNPYSPKVINSYCNFQLYQPLEM